MHQQQQQQQQLRLDQFHQEQQRQQHQQHQIQLAAAAAAAAGGAVAMIPRTLHSQQPLSPPQQQLQQSFTTNDNNNSSSNNSNQKTTFSAQTLPPTPSYNDNGDSQYPKNSWDSTILASQSGHDDSPVAISIGPDGNLVSVMPRWDGYDLSSLPPPAQLVPRPNNSTKVLTQQQQDILPRGSVIEFSQQPHPSALVQQQRQYFTQGQGPQQQQQAMHQQQHQQQPYQQLQQKQASYQEQQQLIYSPGQQQQQQELFANEYLFDAPSPVPTMSSLDMGIPIVPSQQQQSQSQPQQPQQLHASPSPLHVPEYIKTSCSPELPIKASPVDQLAWAPWEDLAAHPDDQVTYATPAHTHTSFDDNPRDEADYQGTKHLKVFTSSKKDDDGEFRKGQQFYLNVHLKEEDRMRYRYIRIPSENIVLPCRADSTGRIGFGLNASGKRSADSMSIPTSAQEEDVLSLKLTTYLEPEHRPVVPCGRCKDKTPEILRFHPGVNGKPMIDDNGMVMLRNGQVKLIASAWCASTSHHRGPGTKFSFEIELTSMGHMNHPEPLLVYQGRSDEVEIYASHGRDKGARQASNYKSNEKKSQSPPHEGGSAGGPPSPAKTSSPPGSPSNVAHHLDMGPVKKRREEPPMTPPLADSELPPLIKSLEPRKGPICQENHVIIIGQNFSRGMTPMFGREYGKVIELNPFYIECTTPRYPRTETVRIWIHHNETFMPSDKSYEFTNEQAQSELEQMLRTMIQSEGEFGDGSYFNLLGRISNLPSSTDISGQSQNNGSTMLHNSVLLGYQAGVDLLIKEGIELDTEDDSGLTALDYAIHTNNVEITSTLLHAGSLVSYERLDTLPLRPTTAMITLLKDVCGVELATNDNSPLDAVPDVSDVVEEETSTPTMDHTISSSTNDSFAVPTSLIQETIVEEPEHLEETSSAEVLRPLQRVPVPSPARSVPVPTIQSKSVPHKFSRALSISTVSTQSTGMVSLAATMSTMAYSATSSARTGCSNLSTRSAKGGQDNIYLSAKEGNMALVKYHLGKDPTLINAPWKFDGRSVLHSACTSSQPHEMVEFLVQHGAQVNAVDTFHKRTALHALCQEGGLPQDDWRIVVSAADQEANERDVLAAMRFLLDRGSVVDAKNYWKETPLMRLFAGRDCPLMVQELYSRGVDSRLKSSKDLYPHGTALAYAAYFGRIKSLKWMVENDLLLNDESNIKDAIRWAKSSKESSHGSHAHAGQHAMAKRKEERKVEAIRLLESWLGESGLAKRKALARQTIAQQADGWWRRMSGIVEDKAGGPGGNGDEHELSASSPQHDATGNGSNMPTELRTVWRNILALSENLASDQVSNSSSRTKWNPLTMLRKST
ncbi:hypothetical protein BGZ47_000462 [Haplosporangium gracile]|nr:hypothetical protein BGZ47_000462 [Haplosporangium gracile]